MSVLKRLRQGLRALLAFRQQPDYALAAQYLTPEQQALFCQLNWGEQLHSLNVLRAVLAQADATPPELASAALLHDIGKIRYSCSVWQKSIAVIFEKLTPRAAINWSQHPHLTRWHAGFIVRRQHPNWGAAMLSTIETNNTTRWLVEHHADAATNWLNHPHYALLCRLQQADDLN